MMERIDKNASLYRKCFYSCETCKIDGNENTHHCLKCNLLMNLIIVIIKIVMTILILKFIK